MHRHAAVKCALQAGASSVLHEKCMCVRGTRAQGSGELSPVLGLEPVLGSHALGQGSALGFAPAHWGKSVGGMREGAEKEKQGRKGVVGEVNQITAAHRREGPGGWERGEGECD